MPASCAPAPSDVGHSSSSCSAQASRSRLLKAEQRVQAPPDDEPLVAIGVVDGEEGRDVRVKAELEVEGLLWSREVEPHVAADAWAQGKERGPPLLALFAGFVVGASAYAALFWPRCPRMHPIVHGICRQRAERAWLVPLCSSNACPVSSFVAARHAGSHSRWLHFR